MLQKKWFRVLLYTIGGTLAGTLVLLVSAYLILKSPAVQQRIVSSLKEPLSKEGVILDVKSLSIDLLAGVNLEGLDLRFERPGQIEGTTRVERLRLGYEFWPLLQRRLVISEARVSGVTGELTLVLPPPKPEPPKDPEALTKLLDLLRHPPATVTLPELALERVSLKVKLLSDAMQAEFEINELALETKAELLAGTSALDLSAEIPAKISFQNATQNLATAVTLKPELTWRSKIEGQNFSWSLILKGLDLDLQNTAFQGNPGLSAKFDRLPLNFNVNLEHEGLVPNQSVDVLDIALPLKANGKAEFTLAPFFFEDAVKKMKAELGLKTRADFSVELPRDLKKAEDAEWDIDSAMSLTKFKLASAGKRTADVPALDLSLKGDGDQGKGNLSIDLVGKNIRAEALSDAVDLDKKTLLRLDLVQRALALETFLKVDGKEALRLDLTGKDVEGKLTADIKAKVKTHIEWVPIHKSVRELQKLGWPEIDITSGITVLHPVPLEEVKDWTKLTITTNTSVKVQQTRGKREALAQFETLDLRLVAETLEKKAKGKIDLKVNRLEHKTLKKASNVHQVLDFTVDALDLLAADVKGETTLDDKKRLSLALTVREREKELNYSQDIHLDVDPSLKNYVAGLEILDELGQITLKSQDQILLRYPEKRLRDVKSFDPARLFVTGKLSQTISQAPHAGKYQLPEDLTVQTSLRLENNVLGSSTDIKAPSLEAKELATVKNFFTRATVGIKDVSQQKRVLIDVNGGAASVDPLMQAAEKVKDVVRQLKFGLKAEVLNKDKFVVSDVFALIDGQLLTFKGRGDMTLSTGRGGFQGLVKSVLPKGRTIAGLSGQGSFELPFTLTLYDKKVLAIHSEPTFQNLSFQYGPDIAVRGMNGRLSLDEELSIDEKGRIGFLYLNTQNPFTRVDFENVDPYIGQRVGLEIQKVRFRHIEAGPLLTNFELRQNLILLNEMKANLLAGSALGRVFIDLHPERLQLGFLGRFSGLQLELLKEVARRQNRKDELSGRAAMNFDIRKRLATGRVDVTSIGRNQLLSMIDVLDPEYKDTQMMTARRALQVSYPSLVSISMEQGLMDLLIGLSGAVSPDINVRSIPLTAFINANAGEPLRNVEKFLQTGGQ